MTANPRPRPALRKAPNEGHPAAIEEPKKPKASKALAHGSLGTGSTSDTLRGKGKKGKTSTLRNNETVDVTLEMPKGLRKRLRAAAKAAELSVDEYLAALLDSTLP